VRYVLASTLAAVALVPAAQSASPAFTGTVRPLDPGLRASMSSWRPGCPVGIGALRLVTASFWGFDDRVHRGLIVMHRTQAGPVLRVLRALFDAHFPIRRMRLVEAYGSDDDRSMAADDTSGFNCRRVEGSRSWSEHAYGRAIDLDPLENPSIEDGKVSPPGGARYADRSLLAKGMIHSGDAVVRAFAAIGWKWGGDWHSPKDYQHFSATGR